MQNQLNVRDKNSKFNMKKFQFFILSNTVLRLVPKNLREDIEQISLYACKTEELKFLHSRINGLVLPPFVTEKKLRSCSTFKTRCGDVFVVTYPKSGTTWLSEIIRNITNAEGTQKGSLMGDAGPLFEVANHKKIESFPSPRYLVSHLPYNLLPHSSENNVKYIYLARNPRDVAVSFFHFMRQIRFVFALDGTWDEFLEYFMKGDVPYGSYFDHFLQWWSRKDDENVLFLKYEDLKKDLNGQVKIIAQFLGFNFSDRQVEAVAEQCTFQAMKKNPPKTINSKILQIFNKGLHVRKGIVGDWKNHFSDEQLEKFNQLYKSRMDGSGLEFEFEAR